MKNIYLLFLSLFPISLLAQTNYCQVRVQDPNVCNTSWISSVTFANINNQNQICDKEGGDPNTDDGYSDYSNMIGYLDPTVPTLVTVSLDGLFTDAIVMWVDWDNSGDWDDTELHVFTGESTGTNQFTAVLSPPSGAVQDVEIIGGIRISAEFLSPNLLPCDDNLYGEIEDYSFVVSASGPPSTGGDNNYCTVRGASPCNFQWIETFECNNVSIQDGYCDRDDNDISSGSHDPDGYSDYTEFFIEFSPGESTTATLTVDGNVLDQILGFIDWDNSGTWEEDEIIYFTGETTVVNQMTAAIVVPVDAVIGIPIKGGVRIKQDFLEPDPDPCADIGNGEIEDYSFIVLDPDLIACTDGYTPAKGAIDQCTNLAFSWNGITDAASYEFLLLDDKFDTVENIIVSDTNYFVAGLSPSLDYTWRVFPKDVDGRKAYGCDSASFTTASIVAPSLSFSPDSLITCLNISETFQPVVVSNSTNLSFSWVGEEDVLSDYNVENPHFKAQNAGEFTFVLDLEDENGCKAKDSVFIEVKELPTLGDFAFSKQIICDGESAVLHLESNADSVNFLKQLGAANPSPTEPINASGDDYLFTGDAQNIYFAVLYLSGCSDTFRLDTISYIPKLDKPEIVFENPASFGPCAGSEYLLRSANYSSDIKWHDASTNDSLFINSSTSVSLTYFSSGCAVQADTNIVFDAVPASVDLLLSADNNALCQGDSISISHSLAMGEFTWHDGDDSLSSRMFTLDEEQIHLLFESENGCMLSSDSIDVVFKALPPKPSIEVLGDSNNLCDGEFIYLANRDPQNKLWSTGFTIDSTFVFETGPYFLTLEENGCTTSSDSIYIIFREQPEQPEIGIFPNGTGDSIWSILPAESYLWIRNDTILAEDSRAIGGLTAGFYKLRVSNEFGCISPYSDEYEVEETVTSINDLSDLGIDMYLNEQSNTWNWRSNANNFSIRVSDLNGRVLSEQKDLSNFVLNREGFRIVQIVVGEQVFIYKLF